jgi:hypothetical protein
MPAWCCYNVHHGCAAAAINHNFCAKPNSPANLVSNFYYGRNADADAHWHSWRYVTRS